MIDVRRLRADPEYRAGIERKRVAPGLIEQVLTAEAHHRALLTDVEQLRARQNAASREIGRADPGERALRLAAATQLKTELQRAEAALADAEAAWRVLALQVPNPADPSAPDGGESDADVLRVIGDTMVAPALDHAAYAERMGFVDLDHAAEASGSRFAYVLREAVVVELALVSWTLSLLTRHGFTPVIPPVLVRERTMEEAGFFPTDRHQVYEVDGGELFLVGTSEIALSALHRGEVLDPGTLPLRYAGFSSCYRREAGTYGKDTRGIFRVHQFDKVEMFVCAEPGESWQEMDRLVAIQEEIVGGLGLPYRVVNIAAGDLGPAAAKKIDLEVWLPSEGRYREISSCSNYLDYSARRLGTRVRREGGTELAHTLNGTGIVQRALVYLFEHYQEADGAFAVPDVLRPYCDFERVDPPG
jgi:seryl-tRNA synthetase